MKTIIYDNKIYKVTDREFSVINEYANKMKSSIIDGNKAFMKAEDDLHLYMTLSTLLYRCLGDVDLILNYTY
jgi:fibrillarin-like rRNA methylase